MKESYIATEKILPEIMKPLVELGLYRKSEEFLREMILDYVRHKMDFLEEQIKNFEKKYGVHFNGFTRKIKNKATIEEEDDWMEWESSINMLKAWKKVKSRLASGSDAS